MYIYITLVFRYSRIDNRMYMIKIVAVTLRSTSSVWVYSFVIEATVFDGV